MKTIEQVKQEVRRRPPVVQQVLRIIATKRSLGIDERIEVEDEARHAAAFERALVEWDGWLAAARAEFPDVGEAELAEGIVAKLRAEPKYGWDRILRGRAN